jgi:hypothetical protein
MHATNEKAETAFSSREVAGPFSYRSKSALHSQEESIILMKKTLVIEVGKSTEEYEHG